jgi:hypothetical protein
MDGIKTAGPGNIAYLVNWRFGSDNLYGKALECVFGDRHPAVHNIWTSIMYKIQKKIYKEKSVIIDDDDRQKFYIRNAVELASMKPRYYDSSAWENLSSPIDDMKQLINTNDPKMIITFGSFAYEFMRRCSGGSRECYSQKHWNTINLKKQFIKSINNKERIVPLLHVSICRGTHIISSHEQFSHDSIEKNEDGNYFEFVSEKLYKRMMDILKL